MFAVQESTRNALCEAFITHRRALVDAAARIVGCRWRAEDLAQDAFLKLSEIDNQSDIQQPLHYLFRMVRNHAIDSTRRTALETRYCDRCDEDEVANICSPRPTPEAMLIQQETLDMLDRALDGLPERTRTAFSLHRIDGETQKAVAERLGVSPTLVNFMIRDAHIHCQAALARYESGRRR